MCVEDTSSTKELAGVVTAVALSRPRPLNESGQPGTLTIELWHVDGGEGEEEEGVSEEAVEVANHALAFTRWRSGRGGWAKVKFHF